MTEQELSECETTAQDIALFVDQTIDGLTAEQRRYILQRLKTHYDNTLAELG